MGKNIQKKNQNKQERVCEKVFRAISDSSPVQSIRRVSTRSRIPSPSKPDIIRHININTKPNPPDEPARVKFAETATRMGKPVSKIEPSGQKTQTFLGNKAPPSSASVARESKKSSEGRQMDDRFTDYINKAKLKIRAMTNLGDIMKTDASETETGTAPAPASKETGKDKFTEFIRRAKMKIRATSSVGGGTRTYDSFKHMKD